MNGMGRKEKKEVVHWNSTGQNDTHVTVFCHSEVALFTLYTGLLSSTKMTSSLFADCLIPHESMASVALHPFSHNTTVTVSKQMPPRPFFPAPMAPVSLC